MKTKHKGYFSLIFRIMLIPVLCLLTGISIIKENSIFSSDTSADLKFKTNQNENDSQTFPRLYCPETPLLFQTGTDRFGKEERQIDDDWYNKVSGTIRNDEYNITYDEKSGSYQSPNRANNLRFIYNRDGFTAKARDAECEPENSDNWSIKFKVEIEKLRLENKVLQISGGNASIEDENIRIDYTNDISGMRQDFIIKNKPEGEARLRLDMSAETKLKMIIGADALMFKDREGMEKMKYTSLKCWDAEGKELRAYFDKNSISPKKTFRSGFSIVVNDDSAVYPVTIDPLSTSPDWTAEGEQDFAHFGMCVSTAGDVNGDGYSDVIIGAEYYSNGEFQEGRAYVYYGFATGLSTSPNWIAEINQAGALFGNEVATAGDVNGDGYSDVIVGAPRYDNGETNEGRAYVYHGSATGLSVTPNWIGECNQAEALYGHFLSSAGDVNGDGYSDIIISAESFDNDLNNEGRVYAYFGSSAGLSASPNWFVEGNQSEIQFGRLSSGDLNGDGYSDILIGANTYNNGQTNEGKIWAYYGSALGLPASANWEFESNMENAYLGWGLSAAGDVNGDGYCDVAAGAPYYQGTGRVYIFHGSSTGLQATPNHTIESDQANSEFGGSVFTAGDVNGDGYSDFLIGSVLYSNGEFKEGRAYVHLGSASGLSLTPAWIGESNQVGAEFGMEVSTAGDVNGDGFSDIIVGAWRYDNGQTDEGRAFVYHGSASGLSVPISWTADGDQSTGQFGISVSSAGDVNGDGYSDVIIGANCYDNGQTDEGRAYVYLGSSAGLLASPSWIAESDQAFSFYGSRVSTAGDVNGDGYSDVMVSAIRFDNGENDEGRVFLYYGSASGLSLTPNWIAESNNVNAFFGYQLKTAGDVNGDGYSDVIIGAEQFSNGETAEGKAFVYHGSAYGLSQLPNWTFESNQAEAYLGYGVSSAGDVNGDGYSDVLVGAMQFDNGQTDEGIVYLFYGSSTGLSVNPNWSAESNLAFANFGSSVSSAGDVNGDGYDDVIIGAWAYTNGEYKEGKAYVYHGSATGLPSSPNWIAESNQTESYFGQSVSAAGDVNGDGYSDVIVGATQPWREGRAFVYHGSPTGLPLLPNWIGVCEQYYAIYGFTVASAGDVNGDGYSDVIIGAHYYNGNTGKAYVYYGNESGGLRANVSQNNIISGQIISSGGLTGTYGQVRLSIFAKNPFGRTKGKIVYEYKQNGVPFSGSIITNSTGSSGSGLLVNIGTTGVNLSRNVSGLSNTGEYKWRARVQYDIVNSPFQKFGPWKYYSNYVPVPSGGFKARYVPPVNKVLTLYAVIQGFYDPVTDTMIRDTVSVYIRQFVSPYEVLDSARLYLGSNGAASHSFINSGIINNTLYYLQIRQRNSIETWNKASVFTNSSQAFSFRNYGSAYGNNQILVDINPLTYAIYSGDVNQDGTIDAADVSEVDNAALSSTGGYVRTDITGDNFTDAADVSIVDNNAFNLVSAVTP